MFLLKLEKRISILMLWSFCFWCHWASIDIFNELFWKTHISSSVRFLQQTYWKVWLCFFAHPNFTIILLRCFAASIIWVMSKSDDNWILVTDAQMLNHFTFFSICILTMFPLSVHKCYVCYLIVRYCLITRWLYVML